MLTIPGSVAGEESAFDLGRALQAQGQYAKAENAYRTFLKQQPRSVPGLTNLGVVLAHEGRFTEAIGKYKTALSIDPDATPAKVNLALAYYRLSDWQHAADELQRIVRENSHDRRALQLLAICYVQLRRYSEAAKTYRALMPSGDPSILIGLSTALREMGEKAESEKILSTVFEQHPNSPEAHYLLGLAQFARQEYSAAEISFRKVIQLAPQRVDGYFYLGATYLKLRRMDAAIDTWKQAVQVDRQHFPSLFAVGALLGELDRYREAKPYLYAALTERPSDPAVQLEVGRLLFHEGKWTDALKFLQNAARKNPKSQQASYLLANTYKKLGRRSEAAAEFARTRQLVMEDASESLLVEAAKVDHETAR